MNAKIICILGFFLGAWLLIHKYYSLGFYDWDFAFFAQAMWGLCHGVGYNSLFGMNFFANHANLIALILVPLYKIFPHPITLLMLKLASFSVASYVLYLLSEEKLGPKPALMVLCLYWLYPPNIYGLIYEFDFENLAPAFIVLTYYYYLKERWAAFIISSILLMTIKENMPLIILAFGIHGFFTKTDRLRWGLVPAILSSLLFYVLAFIFVPLMGTHELGKHPYMVNYAQLNWHSIITVKKLNWLKHLMAPLPLSIFSPDVLFLGLPIFIQHLFSNVWEEQTVYFGYTMTLVPFLFLALINALGWIKKKFSKAKFNLALFISLAICVLYIAGQIDAIKIRYMDYISPSKNAMAWQLLALVPPQAPVIASFRFLPELSQRPYVYCFHKIYDPPYQNKIHPFKLTQNVHYALIDFQDPWLLKSYRHPEQYSKSKIRDFLIQGAWRIKYAADGMALFER